ncbi:type II toxin-antitoxin system VapC family toxin [Ramlibacter albus]|uniref:Type II toxin-antitoxin system VapC family toxin n=1 Tax=Ramlibacter albus TaxID=2079448 RepID=A0A923S2H2_9BURK|nr:type II toxin-antitoxin system VapC family toxin [Ramlibacter albus]MBC5765469.1 type II toxin-antitoxin system VapC family toxin [Ramlibacter albus]
MMFVLDTNVVSELRKGAKANANVSSWAAAHATTSFYISVVTLLELEHGVLLKEKKDPKQGQVLRNWLSGQVMPAFHHRTLDINSEVALECARLHAADPQSYRDSLIAATALVAGMTVVTRDTAPFGAMKVPFVNPWL